MPIFNSNYLDLFSKSIRDAKTVEDRQALWSSVENPIIEDIPGQTDKLVTILYPLSDTELDGKTSIYLLSSVAGYNFTEDSKFSILPHTNIAYISVVLPCQLRTVYNLVIRHDEDSLPPMVEETSTLYPKPIGESAKFDFLLNDLFAKGRVITDALNKKEIVYYKDMDNPDEIYGKESILELPMAPCLKDISFSFEAAKATRDQLKSEGRFIQDSVRFSDTRLKGVPGYNSPSLTRKYWIYLPPHYNTHASEAYPLMLFLDGSSYVDYIPAHSILEKMISDEVIPPCVGVFFDCAEGMQRNTEYHCNDEFTEFLTQDFIKILRDKHGLNITTDPNRSTIIGTSYAGLAAFYTGLTKPQVFGHVIAQSPAFLVQPFPTLDKMIAGLAEQNKHSSYIFELGRYENQAMEFEYEDGTVQMASSFDAVLHVCKKMEQEGIPIIFHEFVGGHNYVCCRVSLYERLQEVCHNQLKNNMAHSCRR